MAAIPFLVSIDLNQNELLRGVLHNSPTAPSSPTPVKGQLYFNTTSDRPFYYDGSTWIDFYGGIEEITADAGLKFTSGAGTDTIVHLAIDVDDASLYTDPGGVGGVLKIKPLGVLTAHIADLNVTTAKINANAVTFAKMQDIGELRVIGRVSSGSGDPEEIIVQTSITDIDTALATSGAIVAYVGAAITALGTLVGDWDASTTNFPTVGSGTAGAVVKGDYYYITVAGTMGTGTVANIGDILYAKQNAPGQTDANWFIVESNRDQATESTLGVAKLSSNAQALAGSDDLTIMTPLKVQAKLDNYYQANGVSVSSYTLTGNDVLTAFVCTHSYNTNDVVVEIHDSTTKLTILASVDRTSADAVTVVFNAAPATGQDYRVVVMGKDGTI